jgi:hypothetical protein
MGRRSRKRRVSAPEQTSAPPPPAAVKAPRLRAPIEEAPKAPWHPFPLVELAVLVGLVLIVIGFVTSGDQRPLFLFSGIALVSGASLELSIREHFAGYRSHSSLLAGVSAVGASVALWAISASGVLGFRLPQELLLVVGLVVGFLAFRALRSVFAQKARGLTFRA